MKNILSILAIATSFFIVSCSGQKTEETHGAEEEHHEEHENENTATLNEEQMKSIQIQFGNIEQKQLTASLRANGLLKVPNQNRANVSAQTGGIIKTILVQTGATVKKGQVIATISNTAFISMQEEYISVSAKKELAELELSRQKELQQGNAGALKNLQSAETELKLLIDFFFYFDKQIIHIGRENVNITLSNNNPTLSGEKPELLAWYLERNNPYEKSIVQKGAGTIKGKITDKENDEPLPFANVLLMKGNEQITGTMSDMDGKYTFTQIQKMYQAVTAFFYPESEMK